MGPLISIYGLLFLFGALLFIFILIITAVPLKGRGDVSGRPILTAFAFAAAIALMVGPVLILRMSESHSPGQAFRMYFGRAPAASIKILNHRAGTGIDYSEVILEIETSSAAEFETFAGYALLERTVESTPPAISMNDLPDWWTPDDCAGDLVIYRGQANAIWDKKFAVFCGTDNSAFAYAIWIE